METTEILDVTLIEPRLKHATIFQNFDSLKSGEAFIIHNDHDPKPLYYQLLAERGNVFQWEYLRTGPEYWEVKISRNKIPETTTIGEIAARDYRKADVFKKFGIDFCCGGKKTLKEACEELGLSEIQLVQELKNVESSAKSVTQSFDKWNLDFLADYIVNTHHQYVSENIHLISEIAQKVARHHGPAHPEVIQVSDIFANIVRELSEHMIKEEEILFPLIKDLLKNKVEKIKKASSVKIIDTIFTMEYEHETVGEGFRIIRELTQNFLLPKDACNSFMYLYEKLKEFEADLHQHVHLENNILFPKALALEREFNP